MNEETVQPAMEETAEPAIDEKAETRTESKKPDPKAIKEYRDHLRTALEHVKKDRTEALRAELRKQDLAGQLLLSADAVTRRKKIIKKSDDEAHRLNLQIKRCEMLLKEARE